MCWRCCASRRRRSEGGTAHRVDERADLIPRSPAAERMNSPLRRNNYTKAACADCPSRASATPPARFRAVPAVEALFAERVSARQGLWLSQRRLQPLRTGLGACRLPAQDGAGTCRLPAQDGAGACRLPVQDRVGACRLPAQDGAGTCRLPARARGPLNEGSRQLTHTAGVRFRAPNPTTAHPAGPGSSAQNLPKSLQMNRMRRTPASGTIRVLEQGRTARLGDEPHGPFDRRPSACERLDREHSGI